MVSQAWDKASRYESRKKLFEAVTALEQQSDVEAEKLSISRPTVENSIQSISLGRAYDPEIAQRIENLPLNDKMLTLVRPMASRWKRNALDRRGMHSVANVVARLSERGVITAMPSGRNFEWLERKPGGSASPPKGRVRPMSAPSARAH